MKRVNLKDVECYWCGQLHGYFEPKKMNEKKCPMNQKPREYRAPTFNRGREKL